MPVICTVRSALPPTTQEFPVPQGANKGEQDARICFRCIFNCRGRGRSESPSCRRGETVFGVCKTRHQIGETAKNAVGPVLNGLIGRKAAALLAIHIPPRTRHPGSPGTRLTSANTSKTRKRRYRAPR